MPEWSLTRTAFWNGTSRNGRQTADQPSQKRKAAHRPARALITLMNATSKETEISMENFSCRKIRAHSIPGYLMKRGIIPPPPNCVHQSWLSCGDFIMTWGCGAVGTGCRNILTHFLVGQEKPMWPCIGACGSEWWRQAWAFWSLLDSAVSPPCLYNLEGARLSSGPFIFLSERNVSLKNKNEGQNSSQ